jgi:hypothetical protein
MNERIKELAEQATEYYKNGDVAGFNQENFAELIVRECAQIAEETDGNYNAKRCVLEHFGVK